MENTIPDDLPEHSKKEIKRTIDLAEYQDSIVKDLKGNPRYQAYFSQFNEHSVASFISGFASHKYLYTTYADMYQREKEEDLWGFHTRAEECLWEIQQKKLFDLQCLWRAGQIELPDIEVTYDLEEWGSDIKNCPFLEPISEDEVELYCNFLRSDDREEEPWDYNWQDYSEITAAHKSQEEDSDVIPEWYQFHNVYSGNAQLMSLPNHKGEKEDFYLKIRYEREKEAQIAAGTYQPYVPVEALPYINSFDDEHVTDFIKTFESKKELELFHNYRRSHYKQTKLENLEHALALLSSADEPVPMEANADWQAAILKAAHTYQNTQTILAMDRVYEEYLMKKQMGVGYEVEKRYPTNFIAVMKERVLEGRVLNGEPRDFNY